MEVKHAKKIRKYSWVFFTVYLIILIYFLFFAESWGRTFSGREYNYNLYPFKEIMRFWTYRESLGLSCVLINLVGNIVAFIPFGFILPIIAKKLRHLISILILGFDLSLFVETIQLIFKVGSFDVDDIILNTLGTIIGYFCFYISNNLRRKYYG